LSGIKIRTEKDIRKTASKIQQLGAKNVIIKGGHFRDDNETIVDIFLDEQRKFTVFKNPRLKIVETHGSGCNFSAAVTSFLAMKYPVINACFLANKYVHKSILKTVKIGKGIPVNNPISKMYEESCRYQVIEELGRAVENLVNMKNFADLIPETQSNLVYAIPNAKGLEDVAGVNGRIVKAGNKSVPTSGIKFGASKHVASSILEYMKTNQMIRSALNIKNDNSILNGCKKLFTVSYYERNLEPRIIKEKEGNSIPWGIKMALLRNPDADIIYHTGDLGKEPMIIIFGHSPQDVIDKVKKLLDNRNPE
jgi:hydroxymethylpyrimidine/phosphomethylpyrimidine kinase